MPFRHFIHTSDKPGSCRMHAYSYLSRPHHRSHVSLSWALPQAFASWEIPRPPAHAADDLLHRGGERWRRYAVPAGRWLVTVGPCCPPGPHRGAHHGRRSPWPLGPCPFGPSLSTHFGWSVLTTVQKHVRVPTPSDLAHRRPQLGSASSCLSPLASPMLLGVRQQHEGGAVSHAP